ncbi:Gfo/Idh/MocA family protein [Deinococcus cellulosilyticus]|uniref:Dehydrogenase n=1 Tax=Deinococcus cellulosilyticus (strain DSM 18568 / NBRC 106333 / KACC 11606 / 5516J-15) TaxID=1223518 RepID=A0A511N1M9_DEIC1|nr:Gfo/Idh/MocA family oxidoreductase [Deinococcus cellulosilyticus]GEM46407.1 dehydrogenase [Deinococcus cellulosilyticus NBRC 106333 = KACC 11606]
MQRTRVGVIGCGAISSIYLQNLTRMFGVTEVVAVADLRLEMAQKQAEAYGIPRACSVEELLADPEIEIVLNLTSPAVHAEVNLQILDAGKHVYTEKPFALTLEDADRVLDSAHKKGFRVGCAPDTFFGAGLQTCRKIIDDGWIGTPYAAHGQILMGNAFDGMHPNHASFFQYGWDPIFDMAPYYLTALVFLLGPIERVSGAVSQTRKVHTVQNPHSPFFGASVPVEAPQHATATLELQGGVLASLQAAKESFGYSPRFEVYGTEGILQVPDPNMFGGPIRLLQPDGTLKEFPYSHGFSENSRGVGLADLSYAVRSGRPHRASGHLARHVIEATLGIFESSRSGQRITLTPFQDVPAPLPLGLKHGRLDD